MINDHSFFPAPFYPDRCDARLEASPGSRTQCGRPGAEHMSCNLCSGGHNPESFQEGNHAFTRCKFCKILMWNDVAPAVQEVRDLEIKAAMETRADLSESLLIVAIRNAIKTLDRAEGGCVPRARKILQGALDEKSQVP